MSGRVCVVGSLNVDLSVRVAVHPAPGETVAGDDLRRLPGGKGANQALAAALAGAAVTLVGRVGDDEDGAAYLAGLTGRGVDCGHVVRTPGRPTGHALITVDRHGENTIVVAPGANHAVTPDDIDAAAAAVRGADVLLLQLEIPLPAVLRAARTAADAGVRVVLNPSPWAELPADLLSLADPLLVNEHEARHLTATVASLCVTAGATGARWGDASAVPPAVEVVDTTGAGDTFAGTLAAQLAAGADRRHALTGATAAAARACERPGAQGWSLGR